MYLTTRIFMAGLLILTSVEVMASQVVKIAPGADFHARLQTAIIEAAPNTTIELPAGTFHLEKDIIVAQSHITLRGAGADKTILNFKKQIIGAQGILATKDAFVVEDLAVEDTKGDGIKVVGANGVVFRRVRVEWTRGPHTHNGAYGLYPVQCRNVLVEDSFVRGSSDAGIYVGQSRKIIVRRNRVTENVAGIEIENSRYADVYENDAYNNTGGVLVFDLPNLDFQGGKSVRVFRNRITDNNLKNFAFPGTIVSIVPAGSGFLILASDDVEFFDNVVTGNRLASIGIVDYRVTENKITDPQYNPLPERISIYNNTLDKPRFTFYDFTRFNFLVNSLFLFQVPHIVYDGIADGTYSGQSFAQDRRICIRNNRTQAGKPVRFGNMHLDHQRWYFPLPGGPVSRSLDSYDCQHEPAAAVALEAWPKIHPSAKLSRKSVACGEAGAGVNFAVVEKDCDRLSSYGLFADAKNPYEKPRSKGMKYTLSVPLFSDYAEKDRFVFMPPGKKAKYHPTAEFQFPVGTIVSKTFSFQSKNAKKTPYETRLMVRRASGWASLSYVWQKDGQDAVLQRSGLIRKVALQKPKKLNFKYHIPGQNHCAGCHAINNKIVPIGLKAMWLNRKSLPSTPWQGQNQLQAWQQNGFLTGLPADTKKIPRTPLWEEASTSPTQKSQKARAYLDINCAHCHSPNGKGRMSGLYLEYQRDPQTTEYGLCKPPVAVGTGSGGYLFDIVPGKPAESILVYRMQESRPEARMPELGRSVEHKEGVKLVSEWIRSLPPRDCHNYL